MTLDEMFFGLWETTDFRWQVMGNEVVGSLTLRVFHSIEKIWLSRTGAAAAMIRQAKGAKITDIDAKLHNALGMDFPRLKADCLTNAARSLGKMFGRDLNRKFEDAYKPLVTMAAERDGAVTVEMEERRVLDRWALTCETLLSQCGLEEMQHRAFESRIRTADSAQIQQASNTSWKCCCPNLPTLPNSSKHATNERPTIHPRTNRKNRAMVRRNFEGLQRPGYAA